MEPNSCCIDVQNNTRPAVATPCRSSSERRQVKRLSSFLAVCLCTGALAAPQPAHALSWDWVPRVLKFENPYRGLDASRYPSFECKIRNAFGDCVVFSYVSANGPDNHPGGGKPKNYYRRVSSFGGDPFEPRLNYSDCQYDDYRRNTAPHTRYTNCDYGEPTTSELR